MADRFDVGKALSDAGARLRATAPDDVTTEQALRQLDAARLRPVPDATPRFVGWWSHMLVGAVSAALAAAIVLAVVDSGPSVIRIGPAGEPDATQPAVTEPASTPATQTTPVSPPEATEAATSWAITLRNDQVMHLARNGSSVVSETPAVERVAWASGCTLATVVTVLERLDVDTVVDAIRCTTDEVVVAAGFADEDGSAGAVAWRTAPANPSAIAVSVDLDSLFDLPYPILPVDFSNGFIGTTAPTPPDNILVQDAFGAPEGVAFAEWGESAAQLIVDENDFSQQPETLVSTIAVGANHFVLVQVSGIADEAIGTERYFWLTDFEGDWLLESTYVSDRCASPVETGLPPTSCN